MIPDFITDEIYKEQEMIVKIEYAKPDRGEQDRFNQVPESLWEPDEESVS
jgi:hypothetical protein